MGLRDIPIKNEYRSLIDDVVKDFYVPLLGNAVLYQRAVGFFSSSALTMIAKGIDGLVQNEGKIQIIASPRLSTSDIEEIRKGYEVRKIIEKSLIREISDIEDQEDIEKLSYIARLVADGILDVKIAFLTTKNEIAMYHEKMGLITDSDGNTVAFSGSMNESENAFKDKVYKVAIMGCVVNGPGEAKEADIGIAGGKGRGAIFKHGEFVRNIPESDMFEELIKEIELL